MSYGKAKRSWVVRKPLTVFKVVRDKGDNLSFVSRHQPCHRTEVPGWHGNPGCELRYEPRRMAFAPAESPGIFFYTTKQEQLLGWGCKQLRFTIPPGVRVTLLDNGVLLAHVAYCNGVVR